MVPIQNSWTAMPFQRYDEEPPPSGRTYTLGDGRKVDVPDPVSPEWHAAHVRYGAQIFDTDRHVTYRATIDPQTFRLDYLQVIAEGGTITENTMRRVPVERIRRVALDEAPRAAEIDESGRDILAISFPGSVLANDDGQPARYDTPPIEAVADMLARGLDRPAIHARYGSRPPRTVDGWIRRARKEFPDKAPPARRGPRQRRADRLRQQQHQQTTDGTSRRTNKRSKTE